jgi:hypothetical protein
MDFCYDPQDEICSELTFVLGVSFMKNPLEHNVTVSEHVLVSLNSIASDVVIQTVYQFPPTSIPPEPPKVIATCQPAKTWTFSGQHETATDGAIVIELSKFLQCVPLGSSYMGSPYFVATPLTDHPCFVACTLSLTAILPPHGGAFSPTDAQDVFIKVQIWKQDGTPAPKTTFNWIAVSPVVTLTNP